MEAASGRAEEGVLGFEEEKRERGGRFESGFDIEIGLKWPVSVGVVQSGERVRGRVTSSTR